VRSRLLVVALATALMLPLAVPAGAQGDPDARLVARTVLPAETFAAGPPSGTLLGSEPINGVDVPFDDQPVQGVSALLRNGDGSYLALSDNGYGSLTNSADYHLRVYTVRPRFLRGGTVAVEGLIELSDPDGHVPFAITNAFSEERILTGADFDVESLQRAPDGTLWFGDEFGPFLLHTDADGRVLEPPIPLPDPDGGEIRSPQNPFNEEASAVRVMNALRAHAQANGSDLTPVFSPWYVMQVDGDPATEVPSRTAPPEGSGLAPASSEVFDVAQLQAAGYPVVPYTVNDPAQMLDQLELGVDGLISDSPDVLYDVVAAYDADGDGVAGDYLLPDGLIDPERFDAQGHRGGRNLRPENTLPAMEVALDELMTTLETDNGVTADGVAVLDHDPLIQSEKCRRADGAPYGTQDEVLVRDLTLAEIQSTFVCDRLLEGRPDQTNDRALSPVTVAFAQSRGLLDPYVLPSTQQLFDFVEFYEAYYTDGPGAAAPDAELRARNAARVRFNIETKRNPRSEFVDRTVGPEEFVTAVAGVIAGNGLQARADVQSFDFSTLLEVHRRFPDIRTVALFGDFPLFADPTLEGSDDGTNLQPDGANTPWLAGLPWPYRVTTLTAPFRARSSGGFEGMALTSDGGTLRPMLEQPLVGDDPRTLRIFAFDVAARTYAQEQDAYVLDERGVAIGDFQLYGEDRGLVIERDGSQGDLEGFKVVYAVDLSGDAAGKELVADLLAIDDPRNVAGEGEPGDVGLEGRSFALPFVTIESLVVYSPRLIGIANDNNFPFSVGRHVGSGAPDDTELVILRLRAPLP
jgi:glycerophosphoryl diester phosphodiesterase